MFDERPNYLPDIALGEQPTNLDIAKSKRKKTPVHMGDTDTALVPPDQSPAAIHEGDTDWVPITPENAPNLFKVNKELGATDTVTGIEDPNLPSVALGKEETDTGGVHMGNTEKSIPIKNEYGEATVRDLILQNFENSLRHGFITIAFDKLRAAFRHNLPKEETAVMRTALLKQIDATLAGIESQESVNKKLVAEKYRQELRHMRELVSKEIFDVNSTAAFLGTSENRPMNEPENMADHAADIVERRTQSEEMFEAALEAKNFDFAYYQLAKAKEWGSPNYQDMHDEFLWDLDLMIEKATDEQLAESERDRLMKIRERVAQENT